MSDEVTVNVMGQDSAPCLQKIELVGYYSDGSTTVMTATGGAIQVSVERPEPDFIDDIKVRLPPPEDFKLHFERLNWVGWVNHDPESTKVANPQSHGYTFER